MMRHEATGMMVVEWDDRPDSDDIANLRQFLRGVTGKRFLDYLQATVINAAFEAQEGKDHSFALGYAKGMRQLCDTISACGLSPAKRPAPSAEEQSRDQLMAKADLAHLGH